MEYKMNTGDICISKTILESTSEQPIDVDFILPDYCPDIQKILKCCVSPKITMKKLSDGRLDIEGDIHAKILYVDSIDKNIRYCEYSTPFSHSFNMKTSPDELIMPIVYADTQTEYINCRAMSPRKLDIHGAFIISVKILCKSKQEIIIGIDDENVEQKKETISISNVISQSQQNFPVNEILELSKGKPPIEAIVRTDLKLMLKDIKAIENKLIVKADAFIKILYLSDIEKSNMETMEYTVPVSQIIDSEGVEENGNFIVNLNVSNYSCNIRSDSSGDDTLIELEARLSASIITYKDIDTDILIYAYSKMF